jgi:VCBS repeat-containing protein
MLTQVPGGLSFGDDDGDPTDPNEAAEGEGITVGGVPVNLAGYFNATTPAISTEANLSTAAGTVLSGIGLGLIVAGAFASKANPKASGAAVVVGVVCLGMEILNIWGNSKDILGLKDPYDPNYLSLYVPKTPSLPTLPNPAGLPTEFRADALTVMQAAAQVASYADALDVTENRMLSAIQDGSLQGFELQNNQLNTLSPLLGQARTTLAQAETKWASDVSNVAPDIASIGGSLTVTPTQLAAFISQLSAGGVSALPQEEQNILNSLTTDPAQQNAVIQYLTSLDLTGAPTDLVSALQQDANANSALGAIYSQPANPNAIANVPEPPVAAPDSSEVAKGGTLSVSAAQGVLSNDTDPNHNLLSVGSVNGSASNVGYSVQGAYGALTLNSDGSYSYAEFAKSLPPQILAQDTFNYTAVDSNGASAATLTIAVFDPSMSYQAGANMTLVGGNGENVLDGSAGRDVLVGGNGADALIGGDGDVLTGGKGPDTFVFRPNFGANTITDFNVNQDTIQFDKSIFPLVSAIASYTLDSPAGAVINDGQGDSVTLAGVTAAQLAANPGVFHLA